MQPTKPSRAGQQQQQQQGEQSRGQGASAAEQTRGEIENQPPALAWAGTASGTNLGAASAPTTREAARAGAESLAPTGPRVERTTSAGCGGANEPSSSGAVEFCRARPDCKQSSAGGRKLKQIIQPGEPTKVEANKVAHKGRGGNNDDGDDDDERASLGEQSRGHTNNDDSGHDPRGQIRFEQQKQRQVPSDVRDPRPDQQQRRQSSTGFGSAAGASGTGAPGTVVIRGLVDGNGGSSELTAARRPPTSGLSDRPTGASDELPVGCHSGVPLPPQRLFNQNSGAIPSEQTNPELQRAPVGANQKQQQQQRIKVTLSKPKQELEQEEEESRKLGDFYTQPTTTTTTFNQQQQTVADPCSASSSQVNFNQVRAPRRSTATLISGSSEPEADSVEFYGGAESHPQRPDGGSDARAPQEKINQIWRDRGPAPPPPPPTLSQGTSKQVGAQAGGSKDAGQRELELTRLERENQLRRIASQRRRAPPPASACASASQSASTTEAPNETTRRSVKATARAAVGSDGEKEKRNFLLATATSRAGAQTPHGKQQGAAELAPAQLHGSQTTTIVIAQAASERAAGEQQTNVPIKKLQTQAQPALVSQDPSLPSKQLAIYINGKIRSNSIFCSRSVSSNSFTSILKSFQHHSPPLSGSDQHQQQPASDLEQQLVCKPNHNETQAFLTGSHNKSQAASAKEPGGEDHHHQQHHTEGQPANKSFVHCLVPRRNQHTELPESFVGGGGHPRRTGSNKRGFLTHCFDYILGSNRGAFKSTGIHDDTQQSQAKSQLTTTNTTDQAIADQQQQQPRTYKLNPSSMFLRKAMRYYRLWIYSANLTILLGAIIFLLSTLYVVSDHRFQLIVASSSWPPPEEIATSRVMSGHHDSSFHNNNKSRLAGQISVADNVTRQASTPAQTEPGDLQQLEQSFTISLSEPTIILAYLMIVFQLGFLQALGCFGAIQMKERLIQAFWYLILALIVTDVLILVYWLQRYDSMLRSLRDEMTSRLGRQYGNFNELQLGSLESGAGPAVVRNLTNFDEFTRKNSEQIAHVAGDEEQTGSREARLQFDKIFSQIFDRIQSESQCCGVSSSLDYKHTRWREARVAQLREQYLKQERRENQNQENQQEQVIFQLDKLLAQLPLVPASCCRTSAKNEESRAGQQQQANVIEQYLDDSQLPQRARVPAWSPSMVVDNLIVGYADNLNAGHQRGPKASAVGASQQQRRAEDETNGRQEKQEEPTLADVIDRRWSGGARSWRHSQPTATDSSSGQYETDWAHDDDDQKDDDDHDKSRAQTEGGADNKKTTRRLAKQMHYGEQGTSSAAMAIGVDGDEREANYFDLDGPEGVARQLQRRAAGRDNDEADEEEGPSTGGSYESDDEDEDDEEGGPDSGDELEEAKDNNNNNESGQRQRHQYRAENDESSSSDPRRASPLASSTNPSGEPGPLVSARISNDESGPLAIETELDKRGRVLARLVELATERQRANDSTTYGPDGAREWAQSPGEAELGKLSEINNELRLGLTRDQFQLIESYLTSDEIGQMTDEQLHPDARKQQQQQHRGTAPIQAGKVISRRSILSAANAAEDQDKQRQQQPTVDADKLARQRARAKQLRRLQELVVRGDDQSAGGPTCSPRSHYDEARIYTRGCQAHIRAWIQSSANILFVMGFCVLTVLKFCSLILLRLEIREMIHKIKVLKGMATEYNALQDLEPYLPRPSICAQAAELTSTGVTSALGVAPCGSPTAQQMGAQPAGLSNSVNALGQHQHQVGVAGESGGGPLAASCSSPTAAASGYMGVPRRIGGSFSEAVAAATAVAHQQKLAEQQQQAQLARHLRHCERAASLANCARAASTKTIMGGGCSCAASLGPAGAGMLAAPHQSGLCPCASSLSMTAHLSHSASQSQAASGGLSLRSDLFPPLGVAMPRRHTAVSVCPAAAAAATAAAHHLMTRRGTFALANPLTFTSTGQQQQQQQAYYQQQPSQQPGILKPTSGGCGSSVLATALSSANMLQAKSLNYLNQHRHSAHAVPPSHLLFGGGGGCGGPDASGGAGGMNLLNPTNRQHLLQARRASNLSPGEMAAANKAPHLEPGEADDNKQPVFRRQASGGAQSAIVNFSLDIAPAGGQLGESRRSIH